MFGMEEDLKKEQELLKPLDSSNHCEICGSKEIYQKLSCEVFNPVHATYVTARCAKHSLTEAQLSDKSCIYKPW